MKATSLYISDLRSNTLSGYAYGRKEGDIVSFKYAPKSSIFDLREFALGKDLIPAALQLREWELPDYDGTFILSDQPTLEELVAALIVAERVVARDNARNVSEGFLARVNELDSDSSEKADVLYEALARPRSLEGKLALVRAFLQVGELPVVDPNLPLR